MQPTKVQHSLIIGHMFIFPLHPCMEGQMTFRTSDVLLLLVCMVLRHGRFLGPPGILRKREFPPIILELPKYCHQSLFRITQLEWNSHTEAVCRQSLLFRDHTHFTTRCPCSTDHSKNRPQLTMQTRIYQAVPERTRSGRWQHRICLEVLVQ
jgi:hypothetical protein